jgi:hypothetical protein
MIIGLSGLAQSGKDTSYQQIRDILLEGKYPQVAVRDAFADRLKVSAIRALFGSFYPDDAQAIDAANQLKTRGSIGVTLGDQYTEITGREYLQFYGTEAHRDVFTNDFWIDAVIPDPLTDHYYGRKDLAELGVQNLNPILIITDCRFPNEAEAIRYAGGRVWEIQRPSLTKNNDTHASEKPLPRELVDYVIVNDGTITDLRRTLKRSLQQLLA